MSINDTSIKTSIVFLFAENDFVLRLFSFFKNDVLAISPFNSRVKMINARMIYHLLPQISHPEMAVIKEPFLFLINQISKYL